MQCITLLQIERVIKPSILKKLKADRENKDAQIKEVKRFYVKVPGLQVHTSHPNGEVCGIGQAVDPSIIEKIYELIAAGETST